MDSRLREVKAFFEMRTVTALIVPNEFIVTTSEQRTEITNPSFSRGTNGLHKLSWREKTDSLLTYRSQIFERTTAREERCPDDNRQRDKRHASIGRTRALGNSWPSRQ